MNQSFFSSGNKLGILGGGQLGKMMLQITRMWDIYTKVLDPDAEAPSRLACNEFVQGNLQDYETVYQFGKDCSVLTIEIEHVNVEALLQLQKEGVIVHPNPQALAIIKDKGLQKQFYQEHQFQTAPFQLYNNKQEILDAVQQGLIQFPFVQKSRTDGYDGKGVQIIHANADLSMLMDTPSVIEKKIEIQTEIAIIAARNSNGEICCYDPVSMDFHEEANMLELLLYPAPISKEITNQAKEIAIQLIDKFSICGLLAVEFLIDPSNQIYINEVAPRAHNSGHQTIESSITSQFEQHVRGVLNLPLGSTKLIFPSAMLNLIGAANHVGDVQYEGVEKLMKEEGVHIHLYGKRKTKPFRKMGHVTVTNYSLEEAKNKAKWVKQNIQVISQK